MDRVAVELVALAVGLVLLLAGLWAWLGWPVALTVVGALLVLLGAWSAAGERRGGG